LLIFFVREEVFSLLRKIEDFFNLDVPFLKIFIYKNLFAQVLSTGDCKSREQQNLQINKNKKWRY
jgi:hypothetical protein